VCVFDDGSGRNVLHIVIDEEVIGMAVCQEGGNGKTLHYRQFRANPKTLDSFHEKKEIIRDRWCAPGIIMKSTVQVRRSIATIAKDRRDSASCEDQMRRGRHLRWRAGAGTREEARFSPVAEWPAIRAIRFSPHPRHSDVERTSRRVDRR